MGQKVCPIGFRIGITEKWRSRWYAGKKDFGKLLVEDQKIRKFIKANYRFAGISKIEIERTRDEEARLILHTSRPGLLIGRKGAEIEKLKERIEKVIGKGVDIKIQEIDKPELEAQLVAEGIAEQLKKRAAFRRTIKKSVDTTFNMGALGVKVQISGRLGGAEIARTEGATAGSIPLHTLRANIDYGFAESFTSYGTIGVKVWIYKGLSEAGKGGNYALNAKKS
ncbi:MAG: 30S ribosomal protein S3 [Candidatus Scalindua sp. AMX11]|nr:MAG: 30S ribosomal protein S3 [Candidatus Scalindua sp.]NOG85493.1 30S ribosomal protein S3 [Planctomycetota bacterium]RZV90258.1 MAG: 30S ribosomal protein S3 [Candidatus Scalindua sp. SCAELEC01]TDE64669.1 MAG: 30S ribosomal protein S3 [Candidatus Scalindua sp. AMX11]GJQ57495.1 MAG: 30S ribosomal protein S3 [Candidatus Scalindua sp.]